MRARLGLKRASWRRHWSRGSVTGNYRGRFWRHGPEPEGVDSAEILNDGDTLTATIGSVGDVKYAAIQEYGGHTAAHEIVPDKAQALAFIAGGSLRFARRVNHPGSSLPARAYLGASLEEARDEIVAALAATATEAWEQAMSREAAFSALFERVSVAFPWGLVSRRIKLWSEVPPGQRPALFQLESGPGDLPVELARHAAPDLGGQARHVFRRPRSFAPGRHALSTKRSTRSTLRWRRRAPISPKDGRRWAAQSTTARSSAVPVRDTGDLDGDGLAVASVRLIGP